jgi:hypothetical protein
MRATTRVARTNRAQAIYWKWAILEMGDLLEMGDHKGRPYRGAFMPLCWVVLIYSDILLSIQRWLAISPTPQSTPVN